MQNLTFHPPAKVIFDKIYRIFCKKNGMLNVKNSCNMLNVFGIST